MCLAEVLGNRMLAEILRDLTARTVLISMLYQSTHDATESCAEHAEIVAAVKAGDRARAVELMAEHIGHVEAGLTVRVRARARRPAGPARSSLERHSSASRQAQAKPVQPAGDR